MAQGSAISAEAREKKAASCALVVERLWEAEPLKKGHQPLLWLNVLPVTVLVKLIAPVVLVQEFVVYAMVREHLKNNNCTQAKSQFMKRVYNFVAIIALLLLWGNGYAQGDYSLQRKGNVIVTWRLVSDFQPTGATCWGWTYHIFISNGNSYSITLKDNEAYQNRGDNTSCWESGSVSLGGEVIPAGKWKEYTFRVTTGPSGKPGAPGMKYQISWDSNQSYRSNY